jgi:hypothetical protein
MRGIERDIGKGHGEGRRGDRRHARNTLSLHCGIVTAFVVVAL